MTIVPAPRRRRYDLVIVGAGVAGLSVALQLENAGADVLLIESGGESYSAAAQRYSEVRAEGDLPAAYYPEHAQRRFGGTSSIWAGYCTVLEERSFLLGGWPISYAELFEFYPDAALILDLPPESWRRPVHPLCDSGNLVYKPYFRSPPTLFYEKYFSRFSEHPHIDVLLEHTVTRLNPVGGRVATASFVRSGTREEQAVEGDSFVLAAGGLGNPRVLLQSDIAVGSPTGAYLMEHPHIGNAGWLKLDAECIDPGLESLSADRYHAIQISDAACIEREIPSFSAQFHLRRDAANLLGERKPIVRSSVFLRAEMLPARTNRFSLLDDDTLYGPTGYVHLRFPERELFQRSWNLLGEFLLREGVGRLSNLNENFKVRGGGHYVGTTRMGTRASGSVVDREARVHGVGNLYVAGSSIFPFATAANPTFALTALAARLGKRLRATG